MPRPTRILSTVADPPEYASVESDLVVILAALFCALICVVGLFAVTRCSCIRRSSSAPNKGLRKKALNSLPKSNYDCVIHSSLGADCPVCLTGYAQGDLIRVLPRCAHGFHVACIDTWLRSHSSCPSCRQILVVPACQKCGEASDDSICAEQ